MKRILTLLAVVVGLGGPAKADHYYATADPQVLQAINQIMTTLGQGCNMGNAQSCNAIPLLQQQAHMMLSAGYDCRMQGNPNACAFYQQNIWQLREAQQQVQMAAQQGRLMQQTGNAAPGMGLTHAQRMQQIHNFGAQNTANFNQRMQTMDQNHKKFIEMIRQ
ncbi:hypothetical protein N4R57_21890 [Rhodobacteraceae bacterium D3-12]|nr:hypothetical protein N4R57_21890 [Rhodobacteraceae bacterium D3-12]